MNARLVTRIKTIPGIELPWERKERYGSERVYPAHHPRAGEQMYPDRQPTGTVIESGIVFVPLSTLEELREAENSWGMGGAFLLGYHEGMALEKAGLATQETRGGYYSNETQEKALDALIEDLYEQFKEVKSDA